MIIPALNEEKFLGLAARSAWQAGADEVIVVDGGSSDDTMTVARNHDCRVLTSEPGRAIQQNVGANRAVGDVLLFLHADNRLDDAAIGQVRNCLRDSGALGGAFSQIIEARGISYRLLEHGNAWRVRLFGLPFGDQGIFIRHDTFTELGGFPRVRLMEDLLLMQKLRRMNWPVLLPGPLYLSARRWQRQGVIRQTLRNWSLLTAHKLGWSPDCLARYYSRHDS